MNDPTVIEFAEYFSKQMMLVAQLPMPEAASKRPSEERSSMQSCYGKISPKNSKTNYSQNNQPNYFSPFCNRASSLTLRPAISESSSLTFFAIRSGVSSPP